MKSKIIYISLSIVGIVVLCLAFWLLMDKYESEGDGVFTVKLVDLNNVVVEEKQIDYFTGDKLIDLLEKNFSNVVLDEYGFLESIGDFKTEYTNEAMIYISIIVDGTYSDLGVNLIEFSDSMVIEFKLERFVYE